MSKTDKQSYLRKGISSVEIFEVLKQEIVGGFLSGNTQLKQADLAERFGVSKIPVREALRRLEAIGLVVFRPRFGATVTALNAEEVIDLLDVRIALECRALELSIPNLIHSEFVQAREILDMYSDESEAEGWSRLNVRFHDILYQACGRPKLLDYIQDVKNRMGPFLRLNVTKVTGFARPHDEHEKILSACEQGDAELAFSLLRNHIMITQKEVAAFMRKNANS